MRRFSLLALLLVFVVFSSGFVKVARPGEVGIKVNMVGDNRGVEDIAISTGQIWYVPFFQAVYIYDAITRTYNWSNDEAISFNSREGMQITADIAMSVRMNVDFAPSFYVKYRSTMDNFIKTHLRNEIGKAFNDVAGTMSVDDIYGEKKKELGDRVTELLNNRLNPYGVEFEYVAIIGRPVLPNRVVDAIEEKIKAEQLALTKRIEREQAIADAEKEIERARGEAESELIRAQKKAEAILIEAQAQAEANRMLVESLGGPEYYVRLETINKLGENISVMLIPNDSMPLFGVESLKAR